MKRLLTSILFLIMMAPLMAQNPDFDRKYEAAKALFNQGQYEKARTAIKNTLKNLPSLSVDQIQKGNQLSSQCDQAIANRDRLEISMGKTTLPFGGGLDSLSFVAAKSGIVRATSSATEWCQIDTVSNGYVFFRTLMNPNKSPRSAQITLTMGRVKRSLTVTQEARPETVKQVKISTKPKNGRLVIDNGATFYGGWEGKLEAGSHLIRAEKTGYVPKDTTINILDDMRDDQIEFVIPLEPTFGRIKVEVHPQEGFSFKENRPYEIRINGRIVENLKYSYDDDREVERYLQYIDSTIPVSPGLISVHVAADSFEEGKTEIHVGAGELVTVPLILKAKFGKVSLIDMGQARDAHVFIDGKPMGTVQDISDRPLSIGDHIMTLKKPGFVSGENDYTFTLKENQDLLINVAMYRYVPYAFNSTPDDARVLINGEFIGNTPIKNYLLKEIEPNQSYELEIRKEGYSTYKERIFPDFENNEPITLSKSLVVSHKLTIAGDESNLQLFVKDREKGDSTIVDGVILPAEIDLPFRDEPYYLEVRRIGKSGGTAYRKHLRFNSSAANQYKFRMWGSSFTVLSGSMFLVGPKDISVGYSDIGFKLYNHTADARLGSISFVPGLTTSIVRSSLFMGKDKNQTYNPSSGITVQNEQFLPAISVALINWDFRVGATFWEWVDVNLLASYAWYPSVLKQLLGFSHISGHDVFIGMEVSSRTPFAHISLKAGYQMYPGLTAHLYNVNSNRVDVGDKYLEDCAMNVPNMFVVGLELSLGGKGKSILRVYY